MTHENHFDATTLAVSHWVKKRRSEWALLASENGRMLWRVEGVKGV
jgi:hypothetical protein